MRYFILYARQSPRHNWVTEGHSDTLERARLLENAMIRDMSKSPECRHGETVIVELDTDIWSNNIPNNVKSKEFTRFLSDIDTVKYYGTRYMEREHL